MEIELKNKTRKILRIGEMKIDSLKKQSVIPGTSQQKTDKREDRLAKVEAAMGSMLQNLQALRSVME